MAADGNGVAAAAGDTRAAFAEIYRMLKEELLTDPAFEFTEESRQWIDRVTTPLTPSLSPPSFSAAVSWFDPCGVWRLVAPSPRRRGPTSSPRLGSTLDRRARCSSRGTRFLFKRN